MEYFIGGYEARLALLRKASYLEVRELRGFMEEQISRAQTTCTIVRNVPSDQDSVFRGTGLMPEVRRINGRSDMRLLDALDHIGIHIPAWEGAGREVFGEQLNVALKEPPPWKNKDPPFTFKDSYDGVETHQFWGELNMAAVTVLWQTWRRLIDAVRESVVLLNDRNLSPVSSSLSPNMILWDCINKTFLIGDRWVYIGRYIGQTIKEKEAAERAVDHLEVVGNPPPPVGLVGIRYI